jgi:N-acyl-D-aspartate/D-glutamate deacylase
MNSANDNGERKVVTSLRDLPQSIAPPRDLWAGIEASITAERKATGVDAGATSNGNTVTDLAGRRNSSSSRQFSRMRWMAAAAVIAALAVGMWIGRSVLPTIRPVTGPIGGANTTANLPPKVNDGAAALQAAYISDPKYREQRAALMKSVEAKIASLPPDSRAKVISSLATIHKSMQDLEAALGKDPSNALLQELLVNTYQDEMRVLTTVHEAGDAGEGI